MVLADARVRYTSRMATFIGSDEAFAVLKAAIDSSEKASGSPFPAH